MESFQKLKSLIAAAEEDAVKFNQKGNSAAGTRLRGSMQEIKKLAQEIRTEVSNKKNGNSIADDETF